MSDYGFSHAGRVFTPNGTTVDATTNDDRNRAIESSELAHWQGKPDRFVAYYRFPVDDQRRAGTPWRDSFYPDRTDATVTTWPGTTIGRITSARVYKHNFGSRFVAIAVRGSNGAEYYGRASFDNGSVIVLRRKTGGA